jgi:copper(I)-binding protein
MSSIKMVVRLFLVSLFLVNTVFAADSLQIENAWSPEAPPVAKVMAGYMVINNLSNKDIKIVSAKSNLFKRVEIHLTELKDGMMRMVKQENVAIKAKNAIELKSGGLHMMLMGKLKPVKAGSVITVTLTLDNGETININLTVKDENKKIEHHHHHH